MKILGKKFSFLLRDAISFVLFVLYFGHSKSREVSLVYHSVGYVDPKDDPYRLNISPSNFERHLKIISQYRDNILITFDDGYRNNFEYAFSMLKKYKLSTTIFLITDFIDGRIKAENFAGDGFKVPPLAWEEIKAMDRAGVGFGSHSKTHPVLSNLSIEQLKGELIDSKKRIEDMLGHRINSFSYPFGYSGSFNEKTRKSLQDSGYTCAFVNLMGYNFNQQDKFALKRIRITSEDGPFRLRMKISGAYDWLDFLKSYARIFRNNQRTA